MRQLGTDRVLALQFSAGEFTLYLEFYAGGNVVLVGKDGMVVTVLRVVKGVGECKVGAKYEVSDRVLEGDLRTRLVETLEAAVGGADVDADPVEAQGSGKKFKKKKKKREDVVRKVLGTRMPEFSPTLIEHCLRTAGVDPEIKAEEALADEAKLGMIVRAFEEAERLVKDIIADKDGTGIKGYIIAKQPRQHTDTAGGHKKEKGVSFGPSEPSKGVSFGPVDPPEDIVFGTREAVEEEQQVEKIQEDGEARGMVYTDFFPFLPIQFATDPSVKCLPFTGFNNTVDTFFSSIESQKLTSRIVERELAATKRLESAHAVHARRVEGLRDLQELNVLKAQAIEANLDRVEEVIAAVNGLVAQGMDWAAMGHLIDGEKKRGNPVAELIKLPLKLFENTVTVIFGEQGAADGSDDESAADSGDGDSDDDGEEAPKKPPAETLDIDIDLSLTAYANASLYFTQKKSLLAKESKTLQSSSKALKSTSRKIAADLRKGLKQEKELLCPVRPAVWFEKFLYFISSDGYLVLAGRDLQQNEILYKRYFRRGDVFVSADEQGATVVIVRNNSAVIGAPVPPGTLGQAGTLAVVTSTAWERKSAVAAWWVSYEQVRKTAAGGDYLPPGVFDVSGKKNYLPPAQLVLGYGVLWMVDEDGRKRHGRHRMEEGEKAVPDAVEGKQQVEDEGREKEKKKEEEEEEEEVNSEEKVEEGEGEGEEDEDEEESDDEEFPDARIESAGEEEDAEDKNVAEAESDNEGFPDADIKHRDSELETAAASREQEDQSTASPPETSAPPSSSKHLTAKAHRDLKKARTSGTSTPKAPSTPAPPNTTQPKVHTPAPEPTRVRGKKGKQKKEATKYAHQDADDRALAMEVLGSASATAKLASTAAAAATREADLAAQKARRREQHMRAAREGLKAEEARRRGVPEEEEEELEELVPLDCFVGTPMVGDNILAAIPVCAPWGAMGTFKYKAKMQPGSVKKGKAVKDVVTRWLADADKNMDLSSADVEKAWPRETELVKSWKEAEIVSYC